MSAAISTISRLLAGAAACLASVAALAATEPSAAKDPGLYLARPSPEGSPALVKLRGTMPEVKTKGIAKAMLLMGHSKPSMVAQLSGEKAEIRANTTSPAFSFNLTSGGGGADDMMRMMTGDAPPSQARNGAEFVLVRLHVKDGSRAAEVGQQKGQRTKDTLPCSSESLGNSVFRVTPASPLTPGEYAFYWGEKGFGGMLWDFGVDQ